MQDFTPADISAFDIEESVSFSPVSPVEAALNEINEDLDTVFPVIPGLIGVILFVFSGGLVIMGFIEGYLLGDIEAGEMFWIAGGSLSLPMMIFICICFLSIKKQKDKKQLIRKKTGLPSDINM